MLSVHALVGRSIGKISKAAANAKGEGEKILSSSRKLRPRQIARSCRVRG
ncbi:MAG: hypothetical protein ACLPN1_07425 [Dissulfurispiraceae bacterium]